MGNQRPLTLQLFITVTALELWLKVLGHVLLQVSWMSCSVITVLALQCVMCLIPVGPHLVVVREDLSTDGACGWLGEVNSTLVEPQAVLAS